MVKIFSKKYKPSFVTSNSGHELRDLLLKNGERRFLLNWCLSISLNMRNLLLAPRAQRRPDQLKIALCAWVEPSLDVALAPLFALFFQPRLFLNNPFFISEK